MKYVSVFILLILFSSLSPSYGQGDPQKGGEIFKAKCASCHTVGGGKLMGPDLQGVTEKRDPQWLRQFIKAPSVLIAEKDPTAMALLEEYGAPMPDLGLTDEEVEHVIAFLEAAQAGGTGKGGIPALYIPTLLAALIAAGALTFIAISAGKKEVEVKA